MMTSSLDEDIRKLGDFNKTHVETGIDMTLKMAVDIADITRGIAASQDGDSGLPSELSDLKTQMEDFIQLRQTIDNFLASANEMQSKLQTLDQNANIDKIVEDTLLKRSRNQADPKRDVRYQQLLELIKSPTNDSQGEEMVDEDLCISSQQVIPKDPISQREISDPVKNRICNHAYERKTILEYIKSNQRGVRCPYVGCSNRKPLHPSDLVDHTELKRLMKRKEQAKN